MTPAEQVADTIPPPPPTLRAAPTIKRCACGCTYNIHEWRELRYVGRDDDGDGGELELRDCSGAHCSSTLAIEIPSRQDRGEAIRESERESHRSGVRLSPAGAY